MRSSIPTHVARRAAPALVLVAMAAGCAAPQAVEDPMGTLARTDVGPRAHLTAMEQLDPAPDEEYLARLSEIIWRPGYVQRTREAAVERLEAYDPDRLQRTLRNQLPNMSARAWQEHLFEVIADRGWVELSPAVVSSWARRVGFVDDLDRAEHHALVQLYGSEEAVIDTVFEMLLESDSPTLRARCWQLLQRLGHQQRLVDLLAEGDFRDGDALLIDMQAVAADLGIVPRNREEILWARKLREPERAAFWSRAAGVVGGLPDSRRLELELRDLPIAVAASIHDPWLLEAEKEHLYDYVRAHVRGQRVHVDPGRFQGIPGTYDQLLSDHRDALTWGDLSAMVLAVRATAVPDVTEHLFDYADRDRLDKSCEYGGVIGLDQRGRFEVLEFPPRFRRRDNEFIAPQEMLDAAYTAVFHFHFHAQRYDNGKYAGPGLGDVRYADNTRANCLVFTFIDRDTMNVDYYRHGRVIVDLGEITRGR